MNDSWAEPVKTHEHWHIDISYINICGTFYYLCSAEQRLVTDFVDHYNNRRLHSAIGYITPIDKLQGRAETILSQRESKLAAAGEARKVQGKAS